MRGDSRRSSSRDVESLGKVATEIAKCEVAREVRRVVLGVAEMACGSQSECQRMRRTCGGAVPVKCEGMISCAIGKFEMMRSVVDGELKNNEGVNIARRIFDWRIEFVRSDSKRRE